MVIIKPFDPLWFQELSSNEFKSWCASQWIDIPAEDQTCVVCGQPVTDIFCAFMPHEDYQESFGGKVCVLYLLCDTHKDASLNVIEAALLRNRQ